MGDFLHRTDKVFVRSGNEPDYPDPPWLDNPIVNGDRLRYSPLAATPWYLNISGDVVTEMSQAEKDAVDQQRQAAQRAILRASERERFDSGELIARALIEVMLEEINLIRTNSTPPMQPRARAQLVQSMRDKIDGLV
jgi:hypothetical protein